MRPPHALNPRHGLAFFQGRQKGNAIPAILLLVGLIVLLLTLRRGTLPTASEAVTIGLGAVGVVSAGTVAPTPVIAILAALLVAAALGTPQLSPTLAAVQTKVSEITRLP